MLWTLSDLGTVIVNVLAWLLIHLSVPFIITQFPDRRFDPAARLYRQRAWEREGELYRTVFWAHK